MKRNVFLRAAAAIMVCCVATLCLLPSTFARYTQTLSPNNTVVRAGIFRVIANDTDFTASSVSTIGTTLNWGNLLQPGSWGAEQNVSPANGTIIAPGTGGRFEVTFENQSEVPVRFSFVGSSPSALSATNLGAGGVMPVLEFATSQTGPWVAGEAGLLAALNDTTAQILLPNTISPTPMQVYWQWPFNEAAHVAHTILGYNAAQNTSSPPTLQVTLQFRAEQLEA